MLPAHLLATPGDRTRPPRTPSRVRIFLRGAGDWCFAYERADGPAGAWRSVKLRGPGDGLDHAEAHRCAAKWAELLGADLVDDEQPHA